MSFSATWVYEYFLGLPWSPIVNQCVGMLDVDIFLINILISSKLLFLFFPTFCKKSMN